MFNNPSQKLVKLDKPLSIGGRRRTRKKTLSHKRLTNPLGRPLNIIFCLPGTPFSNKFLMGWTDLITYCLTHEISPIISNRLNSNVYFVRNAVLGGNVQNGIKQKPIGGKVKYDYLMWIDSDQVFEVSHFIKLLKANKDIVSGLYFMNGGKRFATVEKWDKEFYKKNGCFEFLTPQIVMEWRKSNPNKLMSVEYTGFGWILVKYGIFESMEYPWFRPIWEDFGTTENGDPIREFASEDVGWCKTAIEKGYKIWIDTDVIVGHEKLIIYGTNKSLD